MCESRRVDCPVAQNFLLPDKKLIFFFLYRNSSEEDALKMVFESLVADLLNRFLGDYIGNLDAKQLQVGIWGGDVVLKNLELRPTALVSRKDFYLGFIFAEPGPYIL